MRPACQVLFGVLRSSILSYCVQRSVASRGTATVGIFIRAGRIPTERSFAALALTALLTRSKTHMRRHAAARNSINLPVSPGCHRLPQQAAL